VPGLQLAQESVRSNAPAAVAFPSAVPCERAAPVVTRARAATIVPRARTDLVVSDARATPVAP